MLLHILLVTIIELGAAVDRVILTTLEALVLLPPGNDLAHSPTPVLHMATRLGKGESMLGVIPALLGGYHLFGILPTASLSGWALGLIAALASGALGAHLEAILTASL